MEYIFFGLEFSSSLKRTDVAKLLEAAYDTGFFHPEYGKKKYPFQNKKEYLNSLVKYCISSVQTGYRRNHVSLIMDEDQFEKFEKIVDKLNKSKKKEVLFLSGGIWFDEMVLPDRLSPEWNMLVATRVSDDTVQNIEENYNNILCTCRVSLKLQGSEAGCFFTGFSLGSLLPILTDHFEGEEFCNLPFTTVKTMSIVFGGYRKAVTGLRSFFQNIHESGDPSDESFLQFVKDSEIIDEDCPSMNSVYYAMAYAYHKNDLEVPDVIFEYYDGDIDLDFSQEEED